jgi:chaperonin cofactor prefoldin
LEEKEAHKTEVASILSSQSSSKSEVEIKLEEVLIWSNVILYFQALKEKFQLDETIRGDHLAKQQLQTSVDSLNKKVEHLEVTMR